MAARATDPAHHPLVKAVAAALKRRCGVTAGDRLLLGVSGGADSVALLRALAILAPRRTWRLSLVVGHVQHHLRPDAEDDARLVAGLAERLNLPFVRADLDLSQPPGNLEAHARRQRHAALRTMAEATDCRTIVLAHQADDQLETVLMRLLRGASVRGMAGMAWRAGGARPVLRPMLAVDHAGAVAFLVSLKQPWREDSTNTDATRWRARLRRDVLPVLRELRPDAAGRSVRLGGHFRGLARLVEREVSLAAERAHRTEDGWELDRVEARLLPRVVLTGLLRRLLVGRGVRADALGNKTLGPIIRAIADGEGGRRRFALARGVSVMVERSVVRIGQAR